MTYTPSSVYRDYVVDGVSASGSHSPLKSDIRGLLNQMLTSSSLGALVYETKANLDANTTASNDQMAWVTGDTTAANNGIYAWNDSGSAWVRTRGLPDGIAVATNVAGTANDVTADTEVGVDPSEVSLLVIVPEYTNTSTTMTLRLNGGTAESWNSASGSGPAIGSVIDGLGKILFRVGSEWRDLFSSAVNGGIDHKGTWSAFTTYVEGEVVTGPTDGNWYQLKTASALNDNPESGGSGDWLLILTVEAAITSSITHTPTDTGAVSATLFNILNYKVFAENFATLQEAVTAAGVRGGGEVLLKPDTDYTIGATPLKFLYDDVTLDWGPNSRVVSSHATADIIQIGAVGNEVSRVVLKDPRFWATVQKTDGWCIHGEYFSRIDIENAQFGMREEYEAGFSGAQTSPLYGGIWADKFGTVKVEDGIKAYGIRVIKANGDDDGNWGAALSFNGYSELFQSPQAVHIAGGVGGVYFGWVDISEGDSGVLFDKSESAAFNREFWADHLVLDNIDGVAVDIGAGDTLRYFKQFGGWVSGCGRTIGALPSFRNATGNDSLTAQIIGTEIKSSAGRGVEFSSGFLRLKDNLFQNCTGDGVYVAGTATRAEIGDNSINNNGAYGVNASGMGVSSNMKLNDNDLFSNSSGDVNLPGAGTFTVSGNTGFVTENAGSSTITAGNTTVVVDHGLSYSPAYPTVTPIGALGVGFGVQSLTSTQFTIALSSALGADQSFSWRF